MIEIVNRLSLTGNLQTRERDISSLRWFVVHRFGWIDRNEFGVNGVSPDAEGVSDFYAREPEASRATGGKPPYTFIIDHFGTVEQVYPVGAITPHATRFNVSGVGVAVLGDFRFVPPTDQQIKSLTELWSLFVSAWPGMSIVGHTDLPNATKDVRKVCPGRNMDLVKIDTTARAMVRDRLVRSLVDAGVRL